MNFDPSRIVSIPKRFFLPLVVAVLLIAGLTYAGVTYFPEITNTESSAPDTIPPQKTRPDTSYNDYIRIAEGFFAKKDYQNALSAYQNAKRLKPNDQYSNLQISKINTLLKGQAAMDVEYRKIIASADKYFAEKDFFNAKASYQLALDAKPGDLYAKGKLQECMDRIRANKANNILYDVAIANADKYFMAKDYQKALEQYEAASKILPGDKTAKDKMNQVIKIMVDIQAKEEAYNQAIQNGDKFYQAKKYPNALVEYKNALAQKPDEKYPKDKIAELTDLLAKMKDRDENYRKAIASADQMFVAKQYEKAKPFYEDAGKIKPEETYPPQRLKEIEGILAGIKQSAADYDHYIAIADSFYIEKKYINAKSNYELALKVKPEESYPKEMISKAENLMAGIAANEKNTEEAYKSAIASADKFFGNKEYSQAKSQYESAAGIKPSESYPKNKIQEIDGILAAIEKQKQAELDALAAKQKADAEALALRQQREADSLAASKKAADEALALRQKQIADSLDDAKKAADAALAAKQKHEADSAAAAQQALAQRQKFVADSIAAAKEAYANRQKFLADSVAAAKDAYARRQKFIADSVAAAKEAYANRQKFLADSVAAAKQAADAALAAKQKHEADSISAAKQAIAQRQKFIADSIDAAQKAADAALALRKKHEADSISAAKEAFAQRQKFIADSIDAAQKAADAALALRKKHEADSISAAKEAYAQRQKFIADSIDAAKRAADAAFALRQKQISDSLATAKRLADEALAAKKKADADAAAAKILDDKYKNAISSADKLLSLKSYDPAKTAYANASAMKPDEQYPKDKIAEIEQTLANIAKAKATDDQYHSILVKADQLFNAGSLTEAREQYVAASGVKPDETYPGTKIAAIDMTLADQKSLNDRYDAAIVVADKFFGEKSYDEARKNYQLASQIKPSEKYPKDQVAVIDKTMGEMARQKTIDDKFNASVAKADKLFGEKNYTVAKTEYNNALTVKPAETYPKDRIGEIDEILAALKKKDDDYAASISKANGLLAQKSYEPARAEYENAGQIKPDEQFPKTKIAEINNLLAELKGKKQTFDDLVAAGDNSFSQKNYKTAKESFRQASDIFPDEVYPKQRLARITAISDSIYRANKSFYDKAVADGDKAFTNLIFDKAIDAYTEASTYLPDENYPRDMIAKIKKTIAENAMVNVLSTSTIIKAGAETKFPFQSVSIANRKNNYVYIKIRNLSDKAFNVLLRYGKDNQISGGAVIRNLEFDGQTKDRLISFRDQDPWYRVDNNYISLYPQGGDVEVTFIQISRAAQ